MNATLLLKSQAHVTMYHAETRGGSLVITNLKIKVCEDSNKLEKPHLFS